MAAHTAGAPAGSTPRKGMRWIPRGTFQMGSADFYPEERPVHQVSVDGFWIDENPVTVAEFRRFVTATGYLTVAERVPDPAHYPGAHHGMLVPGSLVFHRTEGPVDLGDVGNWWRYVPGANWRHPYGPDSTLDGRQRHPVTQVTFEDADRYAGWAGKELPTEAEWEYAARGGLDQKTYVWGDEFMPKGKVMANTWHGEFPWQNLRADRHHAGTSPVGSYPPNGYGLFDMAGNVWEWTIDDFRPGHDLDRPCCTPLPPDAHLRPPDAHIPRRVIKGGSHLCAPNYCLRYRPAARQSQTVDTSTTHVGFRCVLRPA